MKTNDNKPSIWLYYGASVAFILLAVVGSILSGIWTLREQIPELITQSQSVLCTIDRFKLDQKFNEEAFALILGSVLLVLVIAYLSYLFYRSVNPPLYQMQEIAERFAHGIFDIKLPSYKTQEMARLADALNRMGSQLRHHEEVRRDFVANVSHELKTPITSIKGFVETLIDGAVENPKDAERFLKIISHQAERLTTIVQDLLTLSHLESGYVDEHGIFQEENLKEILEAVCKNNEDQIEEKKIKIELDCSSELIVTADRGLIEQAVGNLLINASKYSGVETIVKISANKIKQGVEIAVEDQGPGIAEEHLSRIFERFYRVDKARSRKLGGTGLGLAIVKHIATVHGGKVEVYSELGKGSIFKIILP
jgi:signal transduction histidine kinase